MSDKNAPYQYGERVDIVIRDVAVNNHDDRGLFVDIPGNLLSTCLPVVDGKLSPVVEVTLVQPADGAPIPGDLWADHTGTRYVAYLQKRNHGPDEVLLHNGQSSYRMAELCGHRFRMKLVYREPAPAPSADPLAVASQQLRDTTDGDSFASAFGGFMTELGKAAEHEQGFHDDCDPARCSDAERAVAELHGETAPAVKA